MEQALTADWNKQGVKQTVDNWSEVKPAVWKAAGMGEMDGCLCIGCLDAEGLPPQRSLQLNARHQAAAGTARRHLITTSGAALKSRPDLCKSCPGRQRSHVRRPRGPSNPRRESMTDQEQIEEVLHRAAVPIAIEIDNMLSRLPTDADPIEVANDLIAELAACCGHPEFIALFADAFAARQALTELGIKFGGLVRRAIFRRAADERDHRNGGASLDR